MFDCSIAVVLCYVIYCKLCLGLVFDNSFNKSITDSLTVFEITAAEVQNSTFPTSHSCSSVIEFGIVGYHNPGQLRLAGNQDITIMCPFSLFIALYDHNPPTLQTDRRHACSKSAVSR